jgi:hypothetical protein
MAIVAGFLEGYWPATVAGLALGLLGAWSYATAGTGLLLSLLAGLLIALVTIAGGIAFWAYFDATRNLVTNGYGLCNGTTARSDGVEAITPWFHGLIQNAAGRKVDGDPLTFGDLWEAPGFPTASIKISQQPPSRSIDLLVFTTNLTQGRPYLFPHTDAHIRLFYNPEELGRYLPTNVINWMNDHSPEYTPDPPVGTSSEDIGPPIEDLRKLGLRQVPEAKHFPILLAARMSHSFPVLFSSIPLWAIDHASRSERSKFRRCWFSDGGISSNFPMHLFDSFLPAWPTFGIQLEDRWPHEDAVFLPTRYEDGYHDLWDPFDEQAPSSGRLGGFLLSVFSAAQNWNDNMLSRMPSVRDRIARVRLVPDKEGGFNLDMPKEVQEDVANRGLEAAEKIIERFVAPAAETSSAGWDDQRWARLDVLVRTLQKRMPGVELALGESVPHSTSYMDLAQRARRQTMFGHSAPLTDSEYGALITLLELLEASAREILRLTTIYAPVPIPDPELRVRPPV